MRRIECSHEEIRDQKCRFFEILAVRICNCWINNFKILIFFIFLLSSIAFMNRWVVRFRPRGLLPTRNNCWIYESILTVSICVELLRFQPPSSEIRCHRRSSIISNAKQINIFFFKHRCWPLFHSWSCHEIIFYWFAHVSAWKVKTEKNVLNNCFGPLPVRCDYVSCDRIFHRIIKY